METAASVRQIRVAFARKSALLDSKSLFGRVAVSQQRRYNGQQLSRPAHVQRNVSYAAASDIEASAGDSSSAMSKMPKSAGPLSILPTAWLIRSYLITSISSSPPLLRTSMGALRLISQSRSPFLNPDRNPVIHFLLRKTVYAQFCAGETATEVDRTISRLKGIGHKGVMLCYAREVSAGAKDPNKHLGDDVAREEMNTSQISSWAKGSLATVNMAQAGDFVSLKLSGAGAQVIEHLKQSKAPPPLMERYLTQVCEEAKAREVRLQIDAEQDEIQTGIDAWTIKYMKQYNGPTEALLYCTYQAYRKSTPATVAKHLQIALDGNFMLGIKLVRGAYLWTDPRWLFWETAEDTHKTYDGIAESVIRRTYNEILQPVSKAQESYPAVSLILAGHNAESVRKAQEIRTAQATVGEPRINLAYGQLMGMAENISCDLIYAGQLARMKNIGGAVDIPQTYQYLSWGSVGECCQYLVRRAEENQDAASRTMDTRTAIGKELLRRLVTDKSGEMWMNRKFGKAAAMG